MAKTRKTGRKNCRQADPSISLPSAPPRESNMIIGTPRRARLLYNAQHTAGKLPRKQLFQRHNINKRTGYQILKSQSARRGDNIHKRGQKPVLALHERQAIKAVKDALF